VKQKLAVLSKLYYKTLDNKVSIYVKVFTWSFWTAIQNKYAYDYNKKGSKIVTKPQAEFWPPPHLMMSTQGI